MSNTTFIKYKGLLWKTFEPMVFIEGERTFRVKGPYCPKDKAELLFYDDKQKICGVCGKTYDSDDNDLLKTDLAWESFRNKDARVISLDLPPTLVKSEDESENCWVEARLGQKDGKLMAVVYFGEKKRGKQDKKDYSQVFLDFDDEQMRFDKANKNPLEIIAKLKAEFLSSSHISEKRNSQ